MTLPWIKRQAKTVGYVHFLPETVETSIQLPQFCKKIFYWYMMQFYKHMDYLVTVNPYFIERLKAYGIPEEKITYIPNVVSEEKFHPLSVGHKKETRRAYGLKEDGFTVLCAGQLQRRKGIFDFIEIAKALPQMQFVWAGGFSFGKITDGYEEITTLMENPPENVKFLGMVDRQEMNRIYNMADVMFLPSYEELFPMTILEAMNCAVPILVRDLPIYEPILFDYVQYGKSNQDFMEKLLLLAADKECYKAAAAAAFRGHENYGQDRIGNLWKNYYQEILGFENQKGMTQLWQSDAKI